MGFQLCHNIKTNVATSHIPVFFTAFLLKIISAIYGITEAADDEYIVTVYIVYFKN